MRWDVNICCNVLVDKLDDLEFLRHACLMQEEKIDGRQGGVDLLNDREEMTNMGL
jgi:hypothetical protein